MARVFLSLGTNIGNREKNLYTALSCLKDKVCSIKTSHVYETLPLYMEDQPKFLNCVVRGETDMLPLEFLDFLLKIENKLGRDREVPEKGPRNIDLDILLYDNEIIHNDRLSIPHPGMYERQFVLMPLLEIEPTIKDPDTGYLFSFFLDKLNDQGVHVYKDSPLILE